MIIDAHLHLPVVNEERGYQQARDLLLEDLKADGVDYAIVIPDNLPGSEIGDVPECLRLFEDVPQVALMGTIDLENQGMDWVRELAGMISRKQIVGMKIFPGHDPIYPTDPRLDPVYELCQDTGTPMVIHTGINPGNPAAAKYNDPAQIIQVADRYPGLKIVIAHLFIPEVTYCYEMTCSYPNIYYDTSGLADAEVIEWTGRQVIEMVLLKILAEDPGKVIFGTDYAMCSRPDHIRMVKRLPVPDAVREGIFWRNAVKVFNLPVEG